ncbi:hypothetical protein ACFOQM_01240 [Paenibacillus sp. GCM10012307]
MRITPGSHQHSILSEDWLWEDPVSRMGQIHEAVTLIRFSV